MDSLFLAIIYIFAGMVCIALAGGILTGLAYFLCWVYYLIFPPGAKKSSVPDCQCYQCGLFYYPVGKGCPVCSPTPEAGRTE